MTEYGTRLVEAMRLAGVDRKGLAAACSISVQAIGQAINGRPDRAPSGLSFANNLKVAERLNVDANWLATGEGQMQRDTVTQRRQEYEQGGAALSPSAAELGALLDLIPRSEKIARVMAYNAATQAILRVLSDLHGAAPTPAQSEGT